VDEIRNRRFERNLVEAIKSAGLQKISAIIESAEREKSEAPVHRGEQVLATDQRLIDLKNGLDRLSGEVSNLKSKGEQLPSTKQQLLDIQKDLDRLNGEVADLRAKAQNSPR
jgi:hypothetical protein